MTHTPEQQNNTKPDVATSVLERIASEQITPKSRMYFHCLSCYVWTLWLVSILLGAVAVSVMLYVSVHMGNAFYEATHESFVSFALEAMPLLWLAVFVLMAGLAYYNLRKTNKGYRYPVWQILLSSLLLSIIGGGVLHAFGFGHTVEMALDKNMPLYRSYPAMEREWWLRPKDGLLVGQFVRYEESPHVMEFQDIKEQRWQLRVDELPLREQLLLESEKVVKVIGVMSTTSDRLFSGCGVFPWMHERPMALTEMRKEKGAFLHKINEYKKKIKHRLEASTTATSAVSVRDVLVNRMGVCADMPVLRRPLY